MKYFHSKKHLSQLRMWNDYILNPRVLKALMILEKVSYVVKSDTLNNSYLINNGDTSGSFSPMFQITAIMSYRFNHPLNCWESIGFFLLDDFPWKTFS